MTEELHSEMAAATARIRAAMAREAEEGVRVANAGDIPLSAEGFTREWLSAVLCAATPGAEVSDFRLIGAADEGTTSRRNVEIDYNQAGRAAGLPTRLFAKATPEFDSRFVCGLSGSISHETHFYNRIAPLMPMTEVPACYHAAYDPESFRSIFLFEDAGVTKGARFLNGLYRPSRAEIEKMVRAIAGYHGRFWGDPILDTEFSYLKDPLAYQHHINTLIGFGERTALGLERTLEMMPERLRARHDRLWPALMTSCELRAQTPRTLLHADNHLGNWYATADGAMGICDWQCTVKGSWAQDFAYVVTSSLEPAERAAMERDLLALYLDTLDLPAGTPKPSFDDAWRAYRQQTLHGLYNWLFVAGIGEAQTLMHSNDIAASNLRRMIAAVDELETLESLGY